MQTRKSDLPVGRIAGLFGIRGELKCDPSNAGRTLFSAGAHFRCALSGGTEEDITLSSVREHKGRLLISFDGVPDATAAERFVGATLFADERDVPLEANEYLDRDLVGCVLFDSSGNEVGAVQRVEHYPASDMLIVRNRMVPMVKEFIRNVDINKKRIDVDLPPGLIDDSEAI
ncbi:MAG: 16S rRNA processing protein RimM [Candidatus Eremiobacteraeota bacterium]|nr:16S rRNA processing protein RimM [Candidatus Eremiobacteraeota bacterium]